MLQIFFPNCSKKKPAEDTLVPPLCKKNPYPHVGVFNAYTQFVLSREMAKMGIHPEARWPKPGTPFHASPRAPCNWPTPAQTRLWPNLKRVNPILANHPPIGYPISITPTRLWPGYSTSSPHAHASSRDAAGHFRGRRGRACGRTLNLLCSLYAMRLSLTRVTKSYLWLWGLPR